MTATKRQIAEQIKNLTNDDLPFLKKRDKTEYLHRPPRIRPNYGKTTKSFLPKTKISRVLLYDNSMQNQMLDVRRNYIDRQRKRVTQIFEKSKHAFADKLTIRRKWHESWDNRYQRMKDAFIAKYGTRYMPIPTPDEEKVDPFLINARLVPPLNVLCYYIAAQEEDKQNKKLDIQNIKDKISDLIDKLKPGDPGYSRSIEDPRFRTLEDSLSYPGFRTDGYLQLSPVYAKVPKDKKWVPAKRQPIILPEFYVKLRHASRESLTSGASRTSSAKKKDTPLPEIECDAYSLSTLVSDDEDDQ